MPDCTTCKNLQTFMPRADEPSGQGCTARDWQGYVLDPTDPPCAGVRNGMARLIRYAPKD